MNFTQITLMTFFTYCLLGFLFGIKNKKNPFGLTPQFNLIGAFVWTDTIIFGLFFSLVSIVSYILNDLILFLLVYSVFWTVRSIGEQVYWFLEQFTPKHRNPPQTLWPGLYFESLFKGEEIWIVMQLIMLCITVISIISSVYFFSLWL